MKTTQTTNPMVVRSNLSAVSAGVIASLVNCIIFTAARIIGMTSYNEEFLLSKAWIGLSQNPSVWLLGLVVSLVIGGFIGWLYSLGYRHRVRCDALADCWYFCRLFWVCRSARLLRCRIRMADFYSSLFYSSSFWCDCRRALSASSPSGRT
jgi:hypothetical protein